MLNSSQKVNLFDLNTEALRNFFISLDEKPYRAHQVMQWLHQRGARDTEQMTDLSKSLRAKLQQHAEIKPLEIAYEQTAADGTHKWLLRLADGNCIETVFIPEKTRGTLCVSSQVGCALNCSFCSTAKQGFSRNLTTAEIIGQVWIAVRQLAKDEKTHDHQVTNVVMMGMGEPLLNFDNVVNAMNIMMDDHAYGLSKRRVTLSTAGVVPALKQLKEISDVALAISLHAPTDELRDVLVPLNKKYPLQELMAVCKNYFQNDPRRYITMEYVMLDGINDSPEHAKQLVKLLREIRAKVNLIPFNPFPYAIYKRSHPSTINHFREILIAAGINTITRKTRGDDIDAACGQLVGNFKDRTRRRERYQKAAHQF